MADKTIRLIFTDLDGTLLDHETYDFSPALPALEAAKKAGVTVVPATSKTFAEVAPLMAELGLDGPAITENGAALHLGHGKNEATTLGYGAIRDILKGLPHHLRQRMFCFGDMSAEEVARLTNLPLTKAEQARTREASEPFIWRGGETDYALLADALRLKGLRLVRGGRFHHVLGDADKARAMTHLVRRLKDGAGAERAITLALGDGPNDLAMLEAADTGVIIPNRHGADITSRVNDNSLKVAASPGPHGWNAAVLQWLKEEA